MVIGPALLCQHLVQLSFVNVLQLYRAAQDKKYQKHNKLHQPEENKNPLFETCQTLKYFVIA